MDDCPGDERQSGPGKDRDQDTIERRPNVLGDVLDQQKSGYAISLRNGDRQVAHHEDLAVLQVEWADFREVCAIRCENVEIETCRRKISQNLVTGCFGLTGFRRRHFAYLHDLGVDRSTGERKRSLDTDRKFQISKKLTVRDPGPEDADNEAIVRSEFNTVGPAQ